MILGLYFHVLPRCFRVAGILKTGTMIFQNKPNWKDIPHVMQWLCMNEDGLWWCFPVKPRPSSSGRWLSEIGGKAFYDRPKKESADWIQSLEQRPK